MKPRCVCSIVLFLGTLVSGPAAFAAAVEFFPLDAVRLREGPFQHAQELGGRYVLALEPDRLLAGFRSEAGLEPKAPKYPNWESMGLDGHTLGHYLTALAQLWAATGEEIFRERLDYVVGELAVCQEAHGNGYVGAVPQSRELWADVAAGKFDVQGFSLRQAWVPWYNVHKTFAGLRDAWTIAQHEQAREVLIRFADWCGGILDGLSDEKVQLMLRAEHGGMNEVLADVFAITGDAKYLRHAQRFSHRGLLEPLLRHEDVLTGMHANTQIPKVIGFARIAELDGEPAWRDAAEFFWNTVVTRRSVAFGGNSVREHFNPPDDFSGMIASREGPESCNTYNMLRLTEQLFRSEPRVRLVDYYERALYNHILSTQHPEHGGFVYFTPIRPQHYRVYSQPTQCFWCCVGSGIENHGKYGRFIYAQSTDDDALFVNLFIASDLEWQARGVRVRQETRFPDEPASRLTVNVAQPQQFALRLRHPAWAAEGFAVRVNGKAIPLDAERGSYVTLDRTWRDGDTVEITLPMQTQLERLPDGSDYVAVVHGPIVLAAPTGAEDLDGLIAGDARMGHATPGPYRPLDTAPMLVGDEASVLAEVRPASRDSLAFQAPAAIRPEHFRDLELVPFFRVHDTRYVMYWRLVSPGDYEQVRAALAAQEQQRLELERRTLDRVIPGEQQPEVEHNFRSERSGSGASAGRTWRDAAGWFSYDLRAETDAPVLLQITTFGLDRHRAFQILVNDQEIANIALTEETGERFVDTTYSIPRDVLSASQGRLTVKFVAQPDSRVAPIYDVRLLRAPAP